MNIQKGIRGFIPVEKPRNIRKSYHLTKEENERLSAYLKANGLNVSDLIRERISDIIND